MTQFLCSFVVFGGGCFCCLEWGGGGGLLSFKWQSISRENYSSCRR